MFAKATNVGFAQRVVATLVACAVLLWSFGAYMTAQAASLSLVSNTLSDSDPSVTSAHTIEFTVPASGGTAITTGDTITITFPSGFTGVAAVSGGLATTSVEGSEVPGAVIGSSGQDVTVTNVAVAQGETVEVAIIDGIITNPGTIQSYEFEIDTGTDIGKTRVSIVDNVEVTAIVNTVFDFTITGLATSTAINGTSTTGSTTPTEIPFGTLAAGDIKTLAQRLTVGTNARHGFVVTVEQDGDLASANGAVIDSFANGSYLDSPAVWSAPSNSLLDETTWGHWGLTTQDGDLNSAGTDFTVANTWIAASTTPRAIMAHDGPSIAGDTFTADATGDDVGQTDVGYQIEITALQEAADDYTTTLTYIATPTF